MLPGKVVGPSRLLQLVLQVHSLHPQAPQPCRLLFISSSSGLLSPWRPHEGHSRSQTLSVMELCLCEPTENKFEAFKHQLFPSRIKCLFPELHFRFQLTNLIVINLSSIVSTFSKGTESRCDKCLNMRFNLTSVVLKKSYKTNCVLFVFNR